MVHLPRYSRYHFRRPKIRRSAATKSKLRRSRRGPCGMVPLGSFQPAAADRDPPRSEARGEAVGHLKYFRFRIDRPFDTFPSTIGSSAPSVCPLYRAWALTCMTTFDPTREHRRNLAGR